MQNYESSFVDVPLASTYHPQIQIVPLNAFVHVPQNSQFIIASGDVKPHSYISYSQESGFERNPVQYQNMESYGTVMSPGSVHENRLSTQAKAPMVGYSDMNKLKSQRSESAQLGPQVPLYSSRLEGSKSPTPKTKPQISTTQKYGPRVDESAVTLYERASCEDILMEKSNYKDMALNDALSNSLNKPGRDGIENVREKGKLGKKIFRIFNLLRSVAIALYIFVNSSKQLQNEDIIALGAKNVLIASIVFAGVDLLVAFVRCFPKLLWCFWDVKNWDPVFLVI
jgi:hypothetical protein